MPVGLSSIARVKVGETISLRVMTENGLTEVVGVVLSLSPDQLVVRRRDGSETTVDVSQVTAGRVVPPAPAATISTAELEQIAATGWRALEVEPLGGWLLRAGGGFTGRANSALVAGDPGLPLAEATGAVEDWYDARHLPARFQLPDGAESDELASLLADRGYELSGSVHVMTAELGPVVKRAVDSGVDVHLADEPDDAWLASYRQGGGALPPAARAILVNHANVVFASVRDGDECVAIARATVDGRWAGLFAVEVNARNRRNGLGKLVSIAALKWAVRRGARRAYLQVSADNVAAMSLYESLGFATHHDYRYAIKSNVASPTF
jgi:GNAT superfamily N-acetyltransferase